MKSTLLLLILAFPLLILAQDFKGKATGKERIPSSNESFEKEVLELVNKERKKRGLKPLVWKDNLAHAARYHAMDMAIDGYMEHDSKDKLKNGSLKKVCDVFDRMDKFVGKEIFARAENIAGGQKTAEEVMKSWMSSSGHRQNILDKKAKYIGIGYIYLEDSELGDYWVQGFGM